MTRGYYVGMTKSELFKLVSAGDQDAFVFLTRLDAHMAEIGQFITSGNKNPHDFIALMARTNTVFSLPFYVRNAPQLYVSVMRALNTESGSEVTPVAVAAAYLKLGFAETRKIGADLEASPLANADEKA